MEQVKFQKTNDDVVKRGERLFLGLVREENISYYVGRSCFLTDDELQSVFAVALAALREAERIPSAPQKSRPVKEEAENTLREEIQSLRGALEKREAQIANLEAALKERLG